MHQEHWPPSVGVRVGGRALSSIIVYLFFVSHVRTLSILVAATKSAQMLNHGMEVLVKLAKSLQKISCELQ